MYMALKKIQFLEIVKSNFDQETFKLDWMVLKKKMNLKKESCPLYRQVVLSNIVLQNLSP